MNQRVTSYPRQSINSSFNQVLISYCCTFKWNLLVRFFFEHQLWTTQSRFGTGWFKDDHADMLVMTESRCQWMALTQYLYTPPPLFFFRGMHGVEADCFREGGGALRVSVCVSCVSAGVSDNEMQQGTKSWGPCSLCCSFIFPPVSLWFFHTLLLLYSCVCLRVCVYVCMSWLLCVRMFPPPCVSILHGRFP